MRLTQVNSKLENIVPSANGKVRSPQSAALLTMKVVHFVHFRFSALFLRLFLLNRLLFLVMRRIQVNPSAQVSLCPWMCTYITNTDPVYQNEVGTIPK